ncbi:MAG: ABC transporter permease [Phycisphaerae bacterium]|nr:ABC transporter permease [Phycisphaerae bacterium]
MSEPVVTIPVIEAKTKLAALSQWQLIRLGFARHKLAVVGLFVLAVLYTLAVFAEFFAPYTATWRDLDHSYCPPQLVRCNLSEGLYVNAHKMQVDPITFRKTYIEDAGEPLPLSFLVVGEPYRLWGLIPMTRHFFGLDLNEAQNRTHPTSQGLTASPAVPTFYLLGADKYGQDIFTRMIYGSRISLSVGLIGITFIFILGMTVGGISGYVGGATDTVIQRAIEIINSLPQLPMWLALAAIMPTDWSPLRVYFAITIVLSMLGWTRLARVVRGKILSLREEDYAMAARLIGAGHARILFRHLLPGFTSHIIVALTLSIPGMILGETSLSFLGLGLRPPVVSWGVMLQDCMDMQAVRYYPWLLLPVVFIVTTVLCFNFVGDGLRDAADPYSSR